MPEADDTRAADHDAREDSSARRTGLAEADDKVLAAYLDEALTEDVPEERELGERYTSTGRLGSGGQGIVLDGRDSELDREVAIKVLRHSDSSGDAAESLREEARLTGALEHPGVPPVYDLGDDPSGSPFVVLRKVEGVSLEELLQVREGRRRVDSPPERSLRQLLAAFVQVCQTVAYAHSQRVLHLDLKPLNIKLGRYGEVFLLDWGFAARKDSGRRFRGGTPVYAAPEQLRGKPPDERADVYSLGVMLYRIFAKRHHVDFQYDGIDEYLRLLESTFPKGLRSRGVAVPKELDAVVMKAIARRAEDRYPSVRRLLDDLERALEGGAVAALGEGSRTRARRIARALALPALVAGGLFAILAGSWLLAYRIGRLGRAPARLAQEPGPFDPRRVRARLAFERAGFLAKSPAGREEAIGLLGSAVEIDPTFAEAFAARGRLRRSAGDAAGALADLRAACRLDPSRTGSRYLAGLILLTEMGDVEAAAAAFEAIGELDGTDDLRRLGLARTSLARGDPQGALRLCDELAERTGAYSELWRIRASAFLDGDAACFDPARAAECLGRVLELEGASAGVLAARARARRLAGDLPGAVADAASAARLPGGENCRWLEAGLRLEHFLQSPHVPYWVGAMLSIGPPAGAPPVAPEDGTRDEVELEPEPDVGDFP